MKLLPDDYIAQATRDARRYQGQWTGTAGGLAAHTMRLIREREGILKMLEQAGESFDTGAMEKAWEKYKERATTAPVATRVYQAEAGTTAKFGTGAVRSDSVEDFRSDLVSPIGLREGARACAEGASKYSDFNWEKGMPVHDLLNHAIAHIFQFLAGDRSEPHLGHAAWGLMAAIHSHELWPDLNAGTLRGPGCTRPDGA